MDEQIKLLFDKIVKLLTKEKIIGTCLLGSILLHEALQKRNIPSKLQEGFFVMNEMYYGYHIWLIVDNKNYDIGKAVNEVLHGDINKINSILIKNVINEPKNLERIDLDNEEEIREYLNMKKVYNNYSKNPDIYWEIMNKKYLRDWEKL